MNEQLLQSTFQKFYAYRPYVEKMIYNSGVATNTYLSYQDILNEVFCKVWLNITEQKYDIEKYTVLHCITKTAQWVIIDHFKAMNAQKRQEYIPRLELHENMHVYTADEDPIEKLINESLLEVVFSKLTDVETKIIKKRFFEDKTMEAIGKEVNLTKERIRQILNAINSKFQGANEHVL